MKRVFNLDKEVHLGKVNGMEETGRKKKVEEQLTNDEKRLRGRVKDEGGIHKR